MQEIEQNNDYLDDKKDIDENDLNEVEEVKLLGHDRHSVAETCSRVTAPMSEEIKSVTTSDIPSRYIANPSEIYYPNETDEMKSDATFTTTQYGLMYDLMHD